MNWLQRLSHHPIFSRGPVIETSFTVDVLDDLPPSPGASTIRGEDSESSESDETFGDNDSTDHSRPLAIVRGTEIWVAHGSQLRIASLVDFKSRCENGQDPSTSSYKVCRSFSYFLLILQTPTDIGYRECQVSYPCDCTQSSFPSGGTCRRSPSAPPRCRAR